MKSTGLTTRRYTMSEDEAIETLTQCRLLKASIELLEEQAKAVLKKPVLRLVDTSYIDEEEYDVSEVWEWEDY
jgi:hypothetical protein